VRVPSEIGHVIYTPRVTFDRCRNTTAGRTGFLASGFGTNFGVGIGEARPAHHFGVQRVCYQIFGGYTYQCHPHKHRAAPGL